MQNTLALIAILSLFSKGLHKTPEKNAITIENKIDNNIWLRACN